MVPIKHFALLLFFAVACSSKPASKEDSDLVMKRHATFEEFFNDFKSDSIFQVSRTRFPFPYKTWEVEENVPHTALIKPESWRHLTFYYDSTYATRQLDAYTQNYRTYGDTVKVELRGIDNGIFIDYVFLQDEGRWFLIGEEDFSN